MRSKTGRIGFSGSLIPLIAEHDMDAYLQDQGHMDRIDHRRTVDELAAQITELAGHLNAANYRFLMLIAEFDRRNGWHANGVYSCAHWLNWKCGIALGAAREKVRTALALAKLPKISEAMQRGQLSYSKVRAITRVACEKTEEYFLYMATYGSGEHIERLVSHWRRLQEAEELSREARQQASRFLTYRWDQDGSLVINASLPAETGALLLKALDAAVKESSTPSPKPVAHYGHVPNEDPINQPSIKRQRADAIGLLAEGFLQHGAEAMNGGDRHQVIVHVSAETLKDSTAGCCEVEEGPSIPAETARRLTCDSSIVALVESDDGSPLNVGRKTRTVHPALRRALNARDRGCRFPGCTHTRYVDAHHIKHWAHGGETKPSNLVSLCRFHHRKVHEGSVRVEILDDGALRFTDPSGVSLNSVAPNHTQPMGDWNQLAAAHARQGMHIDNKTAINRWSGEAMNYSDAIAGLQSRTRKDPPRSFAFLPWDR